jgi:hypothetical protein
MDSNLSLAEFRPGKWELTSWDNDGQPHWGGAWVQQPQGFNCTSGFAIADNNGHRYMATAGHCFPQGASTNMGTASGATELALKRQPAPAFALIRGGCPMGLISPAVIKRDEGVMIFVAKEDTKLQMPLSWPSGFSARVVNGSAELVTPRRKRLRARGRRAVEPCGKRRRQRRLGRLF